MLFSSGIFLFGFLPLFLLCYFATPNRWRNIPLLLGSLFFYAWAEPVFIFWACGSAVLDYLLGAQLVRAHRPGVRRLLCAIGIGTNVGLLVWFKYANFAVDSLSSLSVRFGATPFSLAAIALPVAISFIVFEKITYLVDLYRGESRPAPDLATYFVYVFFFPKLLAGPIIRYCDIEQQLIHHRTTLEGFQLGLIRLVNGLGKKVLIADPLGHYADHILALDPGQIGAGDGWLALIAFTLQIYFDFSGYSDMAIGLAAMFGFRLNENFRDPYLATSISDFWRRWHISLSTWIRNYVYFPLGGNRCSPGRSYLNLCICFTLSGLWHGAAWNFVIWGTYHGLLLVGDRAFGLRWQARFPVAVNRLVTFALVMIGWVLFRAGDLATLRGWVRALGAFGPAARPNLVWLSNDLIFSLTVGIVLVCLPLFGAERAANPSTGKPWHRPLALGWTLVLLVAVVGRTAISSFDPFLYFRF